MKKFIFLILPMLLFSQTAYAEIYINEIMYDSPGADDDWVEIYNSGSASVTIVTGSANGSWRFVDSGSHVLTLTAGDATLAPSGYAIITNDTVKFLTDWAGFSGALFKSSFSLTNVSNTLSLKDGSGAITDPVVSYTSTQGAKGDGNSLQRQPNGTWIPASPTPGGANTTTSAPVITDDQTASTTTQTTTSSSNQTTSSTKSTHSSPASLSSTEEKINFEIFAGRDRLTTVGNSLIFRAVPTKFENIPESGITYQWSFGDGVIAPGNNISHTYKFAGEYAVVVNANYSDKHAVSRLVVVVVSPSISINRVLGGMEISNNSKTEINLEGWKLISQTKTFIFPADTLIPNGKKVIFADDVTKISGETIQLLNPLGKEFSHIVKEVVPTVPISVPTISANIDLDNIQTKIDEVKNEVAQFSPQPEIKNNIKTIKPPPPPSQETNSQSEVKTRPSLGDSATGVTPISALGSSTSDNVGTGTANTATIFEATEQKGFVSTIFSWPIAGFNFVKRLFVEE